MNILYLIHQFYPWHYTGTEKFLLNLTTMMQKWGHKVKVVTYGLYDQALYTYATNEYSVLEFHYKGIPVEEFRLTQEPADLNWGLENAGVVEYAEKTLEREKPDILHIAHGMRVSEFAFAAQRLNVPYVLTLTDFFFICPKVKLLTSKGTLCSGPEKGEACKTYCPEFAEDSIRRRLALGEQILRGAQRVVAPSQFLATLFQNEFPWLNLKVIPYGIDYNRTKRNVRVFDGTNELVILYAGQINYHKGVQILIDAVRRITNNNFVVKLYGSGPPIIEQQLQDMAQGDQRIQFCGVYKEDEVGEVFGAADLVIIPSIWHENNTIVMREALASSIPVVVSNAGGMVEMVQEGVNGFVFRMGDATHLKDVLERIINHPELLSSMKKNVRSYAVTTVEQEAYAYEQEYRSIT